MPQGDVVGTQTIPVVQANDFVILEFPWSPRDPDEYASVFGMDKAHFCLLARIETNGTAPFGMSSPETADLYQNVKGNNNIAWKNVTVVDLVSNFTGSGNVAVGNPAREASTINLQFGVKEASGLDFLEHGTVRIRMDKEMRELIRKSNPELKGLEWENEKTLLVTSPRATLNNIKLGAQEHHVLQFDFQWQEKNEAKKGKEYRFSLMQYQQDKKGQKTMLGGETFTIEKKKVRKRRFWLWDWLFRLFERKKN